MIEKKDIIYIGIASVLVVIIIIVFMINYNLTQKTEQQCESLCDESQCSDYKIIHSGRLDDKDDCLLFYEENDYRADYFGLNRD